MKSFRKKFIAEFFYFRVLLTSRLKLEHLMADVVSLQFSFQCLPLKMALPAVVPIPPEKPSASIKTNRKNKEVKTSGIELAIALIDAPRTPSDKFLPTYSEAVMNPSPARQMTTQQIDIRIKGIRMPMSEWLGR